MNAVIHVCLEVLNYYLGATSFFPLVFRSEFLDLVTNLLGGAENLSTAGSKNRADVNQQVKEMIKADI